MNETVQKFRGRLEPHGGHWWALVDHSDGVNAWAPIGSIAKLETKSLLGCFRIARWYYLAGILDSITGPIIRENGKEMVEVIPGRAGLRESTDPPSTSAAPDTEQADHSSTVQTKKQELS